MDDIARPRFYNVKAWEGEVVIYKPLMIRPYRQLYMIEMHCLSISTPGSVYVVYWKAAS